MSLHNNQKQFSRTVISEFLEVSLNQNIEASLIKWPKVEEQFWEMDQGKYYILQSLIIQMCQNLNKKQVF